MLSMQNISMVYRTETIETHALRDFSLDVGEGEFVSVTGPSGSGKTTFLNVAGLLEGSPVGSIHWMARIQRNLTMQPAHVYAMRRSASSSRVSI